MKPEFLNYVRPRTLPPLWLSGVPTVAPLRYESKTREWIQTLKFQMSLSQKNHHYLDLLARYTSKQIARPCRAIVPIPSHPIRSLCQVDLSWEWSLLLAKHLDIPVWHNVLLGPSLLEGLWQKEQKELTQEERAKRSLNGPRFRVRPHPRATLADSILLVDDVLNSGSTFREALHLLHETGHVVTQACFLALTRQAEVMNP